VLIIDDVAICGAKDTPGQPDEPNSDTTNTPIAFIPSPPTNGYHLGPLFVHAYGLAYVVAVPAAMAIAVRLVWLGRRRSVRAAGLFALYVAGYSFARIGEELLRVDPANHVFGLRLNIYVAADHAHGSTASLARGPANPAP
jgi:prolipoprotein diacylglyceryltransferase